MAWSLRRFFGSRSDAARMTPARPAARFSVEIPPEMVEALTQGGLLAPRISREQALQVPAVLRGRNLIAGSLATLPVRVHGPDRRVVATPSTYLMPDPDPHIAQSVMMAATIEDLIFEGVAWWEVTEWGWHNYPTRARHVPTDRVHVVPAGADTPAQLLPDHSWPVDGTVYIDGVKKGDRQVIRFDSPNPPLLRHAARAIRTCLLLDTAAALYAKDPVPLGYFTGRDGIDPPENGDIEQVLDDWEAARTRRAWPYIGNYLEPKPIQWNPEQLQLAAQRQHAVLEIARAMGVDPEDLGVSTTSRSYANIEQRRQDFATFVLGPYVSTVQDRLSMRDVLPRGYYTRVDFGGFLRSDTKTRMETYAAGLAVGAYAEDEVRELEDKPPLTAAQKAARRPAAPPTPPAPPTQAAQERPVGAAQHRETTMHFDASEPVRVHFDASTEDFQVDTARRTITGLLLPWGKVANNGYAKWRFVQGSVSWSNVSRVKLNRYHDSRDLIGVATRLQSANRGLMGTFKVGRGPEGDRALEQAEDGILDGFSVEVGFDAPDAWQPDPNDESVRLVRRATLSGVALTGTPAFDDARVSGVKASKDLEGPGMPENDQAGAATFDIGQFASQMAETHKQLTESLTQSIGETLSAGVKAALENIASPQDGPEPVRAARFTVTREAPVYSLDGAGHSLVRDAWYSAREHDRDAEERLWRFRAQTDSLADLARYEYRLAAVGAGAQFATITTGNASQVIPPGYRPDLFVPQLSQGRPLTNALSMGTISNANPFILPVYGSAAGATADHVEGVNPADGVLTVGSRTVTPSAISGRMVLTREIVDSSNPAIDQIALAAMRESYAQQTEAKVYAALTGADGVGGVITDGFVPSGAQALQAANAAAIPGAIRTQLAGYPFARFNSPTQALMGQNATKVLATAVGTDGRPLFPSVGATNSAGVGNAATQGWNIDGLTFTPAWAMTAALGAVDTHILILNRQDAWAWESPLLTFRYDEKSGPALIELALFGYFACHVLRPVGLSGIRQTAA